MTRAVVLTFVAALQLVAFSSRAAGQRAGDIGAGPMEGTWTVTGSEQEGNPWRRRDADDWRRAVRAAVRGQQPDLQR